jgi:chromosome partitioning protein
MSNGKVIAVANTKGGCGKSTISTSLAWAFALRPGNTGVVLVDADPQHSATKWLGKAQPGEVPFAVEELGSSRTLRTELNKLRKQYQYIVIDCPPVDKDITFAAMCVAELVLIPMIASDMDALSFEPMAETIAEAEKVNPSASFRTVINEVSVGTVFEREFEESAPEMKYKPCNTFIHYRQAYRRLRSGLTVLTAPGDVKEARDEMLALAKDVLHELAA